MRPARLPLQTYATNMLGSCTSIPERQRFQQTMLWDFGAELEMVMLFRGQTELFNMGGR